MIGPAVLRGKYGKEGLAGFCAPWDLGSCSEGVGEDDSQASCLGNWEEGDDVRKQMSRTFSRFEQGGAGSGE